MTSNPYPPTDTDRPLDRETLDDVYSATYEELRRLARAVKYQAPSSTLTPSTLVQEAWLRLAKSRKLAGYSEIQFKRIAAKAMYQILVDAARRRSSEKRGGKEIFVRFDEASDMPDSCSRDILALRDALDELTLLNPRQAEMVTSRYFGGLDNCEIAVTLGVAKATVDRDWRAAKAWLSVRVRRAAQPSTSSAK